MRFSQAVQLNEWANKLHFKTSLTVKMFCFVFFSQSDSWLRRYGHCFLFDSSRHVCSIAVSPKSLSSQIHFAVCPVNAGVSFWSVLCAVLACFINGLVKQLPLPLGSQPSLFVGFHRKRHEPQWATPSCKGQSKCQETPFSLGPETLL